MAFLTTGQQNEIIARRELILAAQAPSKDHLIDTQPEVSAYAAPSWNPADLTEDDKNAIRIAGVPVYGTPTGNGDAIVYDQVNGRFVFAPVAGGGGGGSLTVRAADGSPSYSATALEFIEVDGFAITTPGLNQARIGISNLPLNKLAALTPNKILATDASGFVIASAVDSSKLPFLSGVTSDIQTQINALASGGGITALTGDVTASGTGSVAATLANSGVTAGTYTKVTVDAKGRVTVGAALLAGDLPSHTHTMNLDALSDVVITAPTNGQVVQYNGTNFVNVTPAPTPVTYKFQVNFGTTDPSSVTVLPAGWSAAIAGTIVTITHTANARPAFVSYLGWNSDAAPTKWRYRTPTGSSEMVVEEATETTKFAIDISTIVTASSLGGKAIVNVIF